MLSLFLITRSINFTSLGCIKIALNVFHWEFFYGAHSQNVYIVGVFLLWFLHPSVLIPCLLRFHEYLTAETQLGCLRGLVQLYLKSFSWAHFNPVLGSFGKKRLFILVH